MKKTRKKDLFVGVDPGRKGAICAYDGRSIVLCEMLPFLDKLIDENGLSRIIDDIRMHGNIVNCMVEFQQTMGPPTSPRSAFTAGQSYGALKAVLVCKGVPFDTIKPTEWKKLIGVSRTKKKGMSHAEHKRILKQLAIKKAMSLAPGFSFIPTARSRNPSDGMCEAFLLSVVSFRQNRI